MRIRDKLRGRMPGVKTKKGGFVLEHRHSGSGKTTARTVPLQAISDGGEVLISLLDDGCKLRNQHGLQERERERQRERETERERERGRAERHKQQGRDSTANSSQKEEWTTHDCSLPP